MDIFLLKCSLNSWESKSLPLQHSSSLRSPQSFIPSQVLVTEMHLSFAQWNSWAEHSVQWDENEVSIEMTVGSQLPKETLSIHVLFAQFDLSIIGNLRPSWVNRNFLFFFLLFSLPPLQTFNVTVFSPSNFQWPGKREFCFFQTWMKAEMLAWVDLPKARTKEEVGGCHLSPHQLT